MSYGQTVLISPTGDGGFENGATPAANNWTAVNSSTDGWVVGLAPTPSAGSNCAYVSSDGGTGWTYSQFSTRQHLYYDVTIPAGEGLLTLTFKWKANGEGAGTSDYDNMRVYFGTVADMGTPVTTNEINVACRVSGPGANNGMYKLNNTAWNTETINLTGTPGTTYRLAFTWKSDVSGIYNPPAAIDEVSLISNPIDPLHGYYTINNLLPTSNPMLHDGTGNFASFTEAINHLNLHGISNTVIFNVTAGQTFTENCPVITGTGTSTNHISFVKSGAGSNPVLKPTGTAATNDAGFTISGGDYFTFNGIDVTIASGSALEYGYFIKNASATNGAQNNTIANCKITLNRANTSSIGIYQYTSTSATNATGTNSNNTYYNVTVENAYQGIILNGTSTTYPDEYCYIESCIVGANSINDIGMGSTAPAGIRATYLKNVSIINNIVRNVTSTGASVNGIFSQNTSGTNNNIANNNVYTIGTTSTSSSYYIYGIRVEIVSGAVANIYNNMVSNLHHAIATATSTILIRGIEVGSSGTGSSNVFYNSVSITEDGFPSSAAMYIGTNGNHNLANNIFANFSTPNATSLRYAIYKGTGSTFNSNYNDLYVFPGTNSFIGYYTANRTSLADWTTASSQDNKSLSVDPFYVSTADLHTTLAALNGVGLVVPFITTDIDGDTRDSMFPDIGADENLTPPTFTCTTPAPGNTISSSTSLCYGDAVILHMQNPITGTGNSYQWQSSTDGVTYNNISGATLDGYYTTPNQVTYYQCVVTCHNGTPVSVASNPVLVDFNNKILSTTPDGRCGTGTVSLQATATAGSTINWYSSAVGGTVLGTGSPWETPEISTTTNYYVEATSFAPSIATIGTGASTSTGYESPFYHLYGGMKAQYIITATELSAAGLSAGNITALAFDVASGSASYSSFNMSIGHTSLTSLSTSLQTGLTEVYSTSSLTTTVGINNITFTTPFTWDGTSNIIIETCWSNNNGGGTSSTVKYDSKSYAATAYFRADNQAPATLCAQTAGSGTMNARPKMILSGIGKCSGPRVQVIASVVDAPAITVNATPATICQNDTVNFEVTSTNTGYSYIWQPGNITGATPSFSPAATGYYSVVATDNSGGTYDGCAAIDSVLITVNPIPTNVVITLSDNNICFGDSVQLAASAISNMNSLVNFSEGFETWPPAGWTFINAGTGNNWAVSSSSPYEGTNVMFYSYDLSNPANAWAITPSMDLYGGTTYNISFWYKVSSSSYPEKLKVTVGDANTVAAQTNVLWDNNGGASLTNTSYQQANINFTPATSGTYYFGFNCYSNANMWNLYVDLVEINGGALFPCTYSWTSNPAGFSSTNQNPAAFIPTATATYTVVAGNDLGCTASKDTVVTVNPLPVVNLGTDITLCDTASVTLNAGNPGSSYDWSTGGTGQSETVNGSELNVGDNTISVEVTTAAGCVGSDSIVITVTVCTSIEDPALHISYYPNPVTNMLNLDLSELPIGNYRFELISMTGQKVMDMLLVNDGSVIPVNLLDLSNGTYILNVSGNNNTFRNYLTIQR